MAFLQPHLLAQVLRALGLREGTGAYDLTQAVIVAVLIFAFIMTAVLVLILGLRKYLGFLQSRLGPNRMGGSFGALQTMMDAIKLLTKEDIVPYMADKLVFNLAPILVFVPAFMVYAVIPWSPTGSPRDLDVGVIYIAAVTSIGVIGIVMGGWSSNNKYAQIGAFRSAGQMISYEVPMVLALVGPVILTGSFSLQAIVREQAHGAWFIFLVPIGFVVYMISGLAETNLTPFDLVEAESELISGITTEYSGMKFALFYLAEFASNFTVGAIATTIFLGGWSLPGLPDSWLWFFVKTCAIVLALFHIRGTLPRVRVDQLMDLGWKFLIPSGLFQLVIIGGYVSLGIPFWAIFVLNVALVLLLAGLGNRTGVLRGGARAHIRDIKSHRRRMRALI